VISKTHLTPQKRKKLTVSERAAAGIGATLLALMFGTMILAGAALVYDAWHYDDPPTEAQIRWNALDNEWDRNMHDPTQRPPDSIAAEARLKMLLLEETEKQ
jgi:hypothetical protein